jgi:hypothetical protein
MNGFNNDTMPDNMYGFSMTSLMDIMKEFSSISIPRVAIGYVLMVSHQKFKYASHITFFLLKLKLLYEKTAVEQSSLYDVIYIYRDFVLTYWFLVKNLILIILRFLQNREVPPYRNVDTK